METALSDFLNPAGGIGASASWLMIVLLIWSLAWKGSALWHAAKYGERIWFIAILIINLIGIVEIAYLFFFSKAKITQKQAISNVKEFLNSFSTKSPAKK